MQAKSKTTSPKAQELQRRPPPGTPAPVPDLSDMDQIHRMIAGDHLADIFARIGKK